MAHNPSPPDLDAAAAADDLAAAPAPTPPLPPTPPTDDWRAGYRLGLQDGEAEATGRCPVPLTTGAPAPSASPAAPVEPPTAGPASAEPGDLECDEQ